MSSTVIDITAADGRRVGSRKVKREAFIGFLSRIVSSVNERRSRSDVRRVLHSIKVGFALVLASLIYLLDPLYKEFGDNAMWAIMTVVVTFEFYAGATLSKGLNRGIGTILGGGLGCLVAALAQEVSGVVNALVVLTSVFIFGAAASYSRLVPRIKKRYDYGAMIFILTFNLVVVSGVRTDQVLELARERLLTIFIGFCICVLISLLVFPMWASDELQDSLASRFILLSSSIEGCVEDYFNSSKAKSNFSFNSCKSVLHSKLRDEMLVNFAEWEPWHGRFKLFHSWDKYLQIGELLRDIAVTILSLEPCLKSSREVSELLKQSIEERMKLVGTTLGWILKELGNSVTRMKKSEISDNITSKLKDVRVELRLMDQKLVKLDEFADGDILGSMSFLFGLTEMLNKVEELTKEIEEVTKHVTDEVNLKERDKCEEMC